MYAFTQTLSKVITLGIHQVIVHWIQFNVITLKEFEETSRRFHTSGLQIWAVKHKKFRLWKFYRVIIFRKYGMWQSLYFILKNMTNISQWTILIEFCGSTIVHTNHMSIINGSLHTRLCSIVPSNVTTTSWLYFPVIVRPCSLALICKYQGSTP